MVAKGCWVPRVGSARSVLCCVLAMVVRVACWLFPARVVLGCLRVRIEQAVLALYQVRVGPSRSAPCWLSYVLAVRAVSRTSLQNTIKKQTETKKTPKTHKLLSPTGPPIGALIGARDAPHFLSRSSASLIIGHLMRFLSNSRHIGRPKADLTYGGVWRGSIIMAIFGKHMA